MKIFITSGPDVMVAFRLQITSRRDVFRWVRLLFPEKFSGFLGLSNSAKRNIYQSEIDIYKDAIYIKQRPKYYIHETSI